MSVRQAGLSREEVVRRGHEVYDRVIKLVVQPEDHGKFYAVDILSEDFEIDPDDYTASQRIRDRRPAGAFYLGRVGYPTTYRSRGFR